MSLEITDDEGTTDTLWCNGRETYIHTLAVRKVSASGDELKRALLITGLPQYGLSMRFYGDMAKHIVANWNN